MISKILKSIWMILCCIRVILIKTSQVMRKLHQKRQARRRRTKAQKPKEEEHPEGPPEPKPRRQSKPSRDGAPPKKKQSRDRERPAAVKKYEPKHESELSKSESMVDPPKRSRGRPRLSEAEKHLRRVCSAAEKSTSLLIQLRISFSKWWL